MENFYVIMTVNEASRKNDLYSITEPTVTKFLQIRLTNLITCIYCSTICDVETVPSCVVGAKKSPISTIEIELMF